MSWERRRTAVVRDGVGIGLAVGSFGISFGALATASGLNVLQACALSVLAFTGGSQFAFIGVVGAGGSPLTGALSGLLLGSRNALYGLALAPRLGLTGWRRAVGAQLVIDESTGMAVAHEDDPRAFRLAFWVTGLAVFVLWNVTTLLGALLGEALGDPAAFGLDAAVPAAFLALLWPRLTSRAAWWVAGAAAVVALLAVPVVPAGVPVLLAGVVAVVAAVRDVAVGGADPKDEFEGPA